MTEDMLLFDAEQENTCIVMQIWYAGDLTCIGWDGSANSILLVGKSGSLDLHGGYD